MIIDLRVLSQSGVSSVPFDYIMDLSSEVVHSDKPFGNPVRVFGTISQSSGIVWFKAEAETVLTPRCARCLRVFEKPMKVAMSFVLSTDKPASDGEMYDDTIYLDSALVETDDIVFPELILDLDMVQLCSPDCRGLCPRCGHDLNEGPCNCSEN